MDSWGWKGVSQITILLHKPYLVKVTTKGGEGSKIPKTSNTRFMNDPLDCVMHSTTTNNIFPKINKFVYHAIYNFWVLHIYTMTIATNSIHHFWQNQKNHLWHSKRICACKLAPSKNVFWQKQNATNIGEKQINNAMRKVLNSSSAKLWDQMIN